jgi:hypothetical protein
MEIRNGVPTMKQPIIIFSVILAIVSLLPGLASGAEWHVCAPETCGASGDGLDWGNPLAELPSSLNRGDTYYIADGTYGSYTFDDAESGSRYITIRKATASDHGTDMDWLPSYGDGQAYFESLENIPVWRFYSPYYIIDGQTGYGDGSAESYGIKLKVLESHIVGTGTSVANVYIDRDAINNGHHINFSHVEMEHAGENIHQPMCQRCSAFYVTGEAGNEVTDIHLDNCYMHNVTGVNVHTDDARNISFDRCYFARRGHWWDGETQCHGEGFAIHPDADGLTISNSVFEDIEGTGIIVFGLVNGGDFSNTDIYNNIFFSNDPVKYAVTGVVISTNSASFDNIRVHHNTFANLSVPATSNYLKIAGFQAGITTDSYAYNNIIYNIAEDKYGPYFGEITHDYNLCYSAGGKCGNYFVAGGDVADETNGQVAAADPLKDFSNKNFRLNGPTDPGIVLPSPFNVDPDGNARTDWDRGVYEYVPPSNTHYVRSDAPSGGDGSDWGKALQILPGSLERGHTYYIADGTYGSYTFDDAESGTQYITIRKATASDHGTDIGWDSSYGDGQVVFDAAALAFNTGYYDFDGQVGGGPDNWKTGHGFVFTSPAGTNIAYISMSSGVSNMYVHHAFFTQTGNTEAYPVGGHGFYDSGTLSNSLFEYCYFDNLGGLPFFFREGSGNIIQYNYLGNICGQSVYDVNQHCEGVVIHGMSNTHFRWNYVADCPSSGGFVKNDVESSDSIRIYGNVFENGFPINCNTGPCTNWRVFSNTFHSFGGGPVGGDGAYGSDNYFYDNIMYGASFLGQLRGSHDYNWFSSCSGLRCTMNSSAHENVCVDCVSGCDSITETLNPFVNSTGDTPEDFRLSAAIIGQNGYDVCQLDSCAGENKYNIDVFGSIRGADGTWDMGAYEFASGQQYHRSDTNTNGCVELNEMIAFMNRWKLSVADVGMPEMMESIGLWKEGTGC